MSSYVARDAWVSMMKPVPIWMIPSSGPASRSRAVAFVLCSRDLGGYAKRLGPEVHNLSTKRCQASADASRSARPGVAPACIARKRNRNPRQGEARN